MLSENSIYQQAADLHKRNPQRDYVAVDSLDTFRCIHNRVLIKIDVDKYEKIGSIILGDEGFLDSQNRYNPSVHAVRCGTIVKQPEKYLYHDKGNESHNTTIETFIGDTVFFPVVESMNCPLILCGDDYYLLMNYEVLYLVKRHMMIEEESDNVIFVDGDWFNVIMLNGYLLCERYYEIDNNPLRIDDGKVLVKKYAKVVFSGSPVVSRQIQTTAIPSTKRGCKAYSDGRFVASNPEVKNGDTILIHRTVQESEVLLEDELHLYFDGKFPYRLVQRKYVDAIV